MKESNGSKIRMVLVGFVAAFLVVGGGSANADFIWRTPTNLGPEINSPSHETSPSISADGLSLYFGSDRAGGSGEFDLWVTTRPTRYAAWGPAVNLGPQVNSEYAETDPSISSDGLSLYFSDPHKGIGFGRPRPGGFASGDGGNVWVVTRATVNDPWSAPVNLGPALNSTNYDQVVHPSISADGLSLYVHACAQGIGVARRASTTEPFGTPELLNFPGNNGANDWWPNISADGCTLFVSVWSWSTEVYQLWVTTRPTADSDFGLPTKLPAPINISDRLVFCPNLSADGSTLLFSSDRPGGVGGYDIWQVSIGPPVVDFDGDQKVDFNDFAIFAQSAYDDGELDAEALALLAEHWLEDLRLVAHWKLDEEDGGIAYDSAGDNDGTLHGDPNWQPTAGSVAGAIELDGIDDYVSTDFVLDPADGPFSVYAWVKGGAPGQVAISQTNDAAIGPSWLAADSSGCLMTTVTPPGRLPLPLVSEFVMTDGDWHHIGLVWDGSHRFLYADEAEVAKDSEARPGLAGVTGGLHFGAAYNLEATTFFDGMIDDIRIYDQAVTP